MPWFLKAGEISFHIAVANEIKNSNSLIPKVNPFLYGSQIYYPVAYHAQLVLVSKYTNVPVYILIHLEQFLAAIIFFILTFLIGYEYLKDIDMAIVFMVFLSLFWLQIYYVPSPFANLSLNMMLLEFYFFLMFVNRKKIKYALLAGIICGFLAYVQPTSFMFGCLVVFSFVLYDLVFGKVNLKHTLAMLLPLLLAMPFLLSIKEISAKTFLFEPFAGLMYNYPKIFNVLLIGLLFSLISMRKKLSKFQIVSLILLIVLFVFVNTFVMTYSYDIVRFVYFMMFPILFITLPYVKTLGSSKKVLFIIATVLCLLFIKIEAYSVVDNIKFYSFNQTVFQTDEYKASEWVYKNTNLDDVILSSPTSFYILERRTVISYPYTHSVYMLDPRKNFVDASIMYTIPSRELYEKYNVSYVMLCKPEYDFLQAYNLTFYNFSSSKAFKSVVKYDNCTVFRVDDKSKLQNITYVNIEDKLIKAQYSRWWIVDY
jgi:hypothetical protein